MRRLLFVRHARELGFEIEAVRTLLRMQDHPNRSCEDIDALVADHLEAVDTKIERLMSFVGSCS